MRGMRAWELAWRSPEHSAARSRSPLVESGHERQIRSTWMWIADGRNRAIARQAFSDHLPRGILDRRSKGSYTGYMATIYARNKPKMREFLADGQLCAHDLLDRSALANFLAKDVAPRDLSFLRIFDLCAAENWARQQCHDPS